MRIKLARCKQTVDGRNRTEQEEGENGYSASKPESFMWNGNEVELLLRLTLNYKARKAQYLLRHEHEHVVRHCCCCCCYETWRGSEVRGNRSRGGAMASSFRKVIRRPHENGRAAFSDFSTLRPVFKKVRFRDPCGRSAKTMQCVCVFAKERFHVDGPQ